MNLNWLLAFSLFLTASLVGAQVCKRIKVSPLIGEIGAGIVFSFIFHALAIQYDHHLLEIFSELSIIFILFLIGMETNLDEILGVWKPAFSVAVLGVVVPFLFGIALGKYYGWSVPVMLFVSATMVATSVTVSVRVFFDLGFVQHRSSQIVVGAAIIDDILGLLVLTFVMAAAGNTEGATSLKLAKMGLFLLVVLPAVWFIAPKFLRWMENRGGTDLTGFQSISFLFFLSFLANWCGLAPIVGAFFLGVVLTRSHEDKIKHLVHPFYLLMAPIFFFSIGFQIEMDAIVKGFSLGMILSAAAFLSKVIGGYLGAVILKIPHHESLLIGTAMAPRGEVGLIIAGIGKSMGIVTDDIFAAAAFMCLLTTLVPPFFLPPLIRWVQKN